MKLGARRIGIGDGRFEAIRRGFAAFHDCSEVPAAIALPQDPDEVAEAVGWARENGMPFRVRSGGHSFEGFSSRVHAGLIIDLRDLDTVHVDREHHTVVAGPGVRMRQLTEQLAESGLGLPLATGPSVGLGGLCLGGGFGLCSRRHGLTCDNLIEAEVVLADGTIVQANHEQNPDLFWALRGGGGGNFGIVTRFKLRAHPMREVGVFMIQFPWAEFERVVDTWQNWAPHADWGLTSFVTLTAERQILVRGQYTPRSGEIAHLEGLLDPMLAGASADFVGGQAVSAIDAAGIAVEAVEGGQERASQLFKSTSAFAHTPLPPEAIRLLKAGLETPPVLREAPSQPAMIQLLSGGGQMAVPATDDTAAFHRRAQFLIQYDGYWTAPEDAEPTRSWVTELRRKLLPWSRGAYVNYVDSDLGEDWQEQYYGANAPKLRELKRRWDPENHFQFPQSIPQR